MSSFQTRNAHIQTQNVHIQTLNVHIQTQNVHIQTRNVHIQTRNAHIQTQNVLFQSSNDELVRDGFEESGLVVLGPDDVSRSGSDRLSLEVGNGGSVLLALASRRVVTFHAVQEILTTAGMAHVLSTDANLLLFNAIAHGLGDDDAQRTISHVEDASSAAVVVFVRHAGVNGSVGFDVDDVADLINLQERRD